MGWVGEWVDVDPTKMSIHSRLHRGGICPNEGFPRNCTLTVPMAYSCLINFLSQSDSRPSLVWTAPSLKQSSGVDVKFSVVSIYCQTTAHSNGAGASSDLDIFNKYDYGHNLVRSNQIYS